MKTAILGVLLVPIAASVLGAAVAATGARNPSVRTSASPIRRIGTSRWGWLAGV